MYDAILINDDLSINGYRGMNKKVNPKKNYWMGKDTDERKALRFEEKKELYNSRPFYSKMQQVIEEKLPKRADKITVLNLVNNPKNGIKNEEVLWSGINDFLKGKEMIDKNELLEFLRMNELDIKEEFKGGDIEYPYEVKKQLDDITKQKNVVFNELLNMFDGDSNGIWIQDQLSLAFSENDTVKMIKLIEDSTLEYKYERKAEFLRFDLVLLDIDRDNLTREYRIENKTIHDIYQVAGGQNYKELLFILNTDNKQKKYVSPKKHWDELNILAFTRFNDRVDVNGNKVLFIEELQSDWHK
jgi:hypothetical protein